MRLKEPKRDLRILWLIFQSSYLYTIKCVCCEKRNLELCHCEKCVSPHFHFLRALSKCRYQTYHTRYNVIQSFNISNMIEYNFISLFSSSAVAAAPADPHMVAPLVRPTSPTSRIVCCCTRVRWTRQKRSRRLQANGRST